MIDFGCNSKYSTGTRLEKIILYRLDKKETNNNGTESRLQENDIRGNRKAWSQ